MRIKNHRLVGDDGAPAPFIQAACQGRKIRPRFLIMHYTAGGPARSTVAYFASRQARASAHFVIGRDGAVTQQVACNRAAWHAGRSQWQGVTGLNSHSIGIELANWGLLKRRPGGYRSYTGQQIEQSRVVFAIHKNGGGQREAWEGFPEAQVQSAIAVAIAIASAYGIAEDAILGHDDIAPRRKIDPGPAFDMDLFRARVSGRGDDGAETPQLRRVASKTGLHLRAGPGIGHASLLLLADGAEVEIIEKPSRWWLVAAVDNGMADRTGYVHSHWLR